MILLEGDYGGIIFLILGIMFGPPVVLALIGVLLHRKYKTAAKVFYILAVVYLIISLGICGSMG